VPILIRAHNGKGKEKRTEKVKISTTVDSDKLDIFFSRYAEICKSGMVSLKPRDRKKKKAKARTKKGGAGVAA
jgi:signal recognition particle subunit SRP14